MGAHGSTGGGHFLASRAWIRNSQKIKLAMIYPLALALAQRARAIFRACSDRSAGVILAAFRRAIFAAHALMILSVTV